MKNGFRLTVTKQAALLFTTGILLVNNPAITKAADEPVMGMPNPMVEYDSVIDARKAAGFMPLHLPEISGYHVKEVFVYHKDLVDIRYAADNSQTQMQIRTAKAGRQSGDDISGIYGAKWEKESIAGIEVAIAKLPAGSNGYAAHWSINGMLFSVTAEHIAQPEFQHILKSGLVDLSRHYF